MSASLGYRVDGPAGAPVLVLGGSLGTDVRMWEPQLPALTTTFRVVRYDHRGHGASEIPAGPYSIADLAGDVLALLDHLGVARAHLGGLSLGGMAAMWLAAHAPARVDRLALFCTSAYLPPAQGWLDRAAAVRSGGMPAVAGPVSARWFTPSYAAAHPEVASAYREMLISQPAQGYAACCEAVAAMDLRDALPAIQAPTLVVAARGDPATPEPHARVIAAGISAGGASVHTELVDAAHLATVENPPACTGLLVEHLTR
jgi:3-oxoadipate enol-lactonase